MKTPNLRVVVKDDSEIRGKADMTTEETTTMKVSVKVWKRLNSLKMPRDSFDDVLRRLLGME